MNAHKAPMILTAASIILLSLLLGYVKMASGSDDRDRLLEGLTPTVAGYCVDNHWILYPCVKYVKKGEAWFYLAVLSTDASKVLYILRVEGAAQTVVWQRGLLL